VLCFAATNPNLYVKYKEVFDASVSKCRRREIYAESENCKVELKAGESDRLDFIFSGKSFCCARTHRAEELFPATGLWMKRLMRKRQCFWNFGDTSGSDAAVVICGEKDNFLSVDLSYLPWYQTRHCSFP
jgi:hypothetical protein